MKPLLIFLSVVLAGVVLFMMQNYEPVTVRFLFWSFSASRALLLFFVFLAGVITGLAGAIAGRRCAIRKNGEQQ